MRIAESKWKSGSDSSDDPLFVKAEKGDLGILKDPMVAKVQSDLFGLTPLHILADKGKKEVLKHPMAAVAQDGTGETPLHYLASAGVVDVLKHKMVSRVTDGQNRTPLHCLADAGKIEVLKHRDVSKVGDSAGDTPLHVIARKKGLSSGEKREILKHPDANKVKCRHDLTPADYLRETSFGRRDSKRLGMRSTIEELRDLLENFEFKGKPETPEELARAAKKHDGSLSDPLMGREGTYWRADFRDKKDAEAFLRDVKKIKEIEPDWDKPKQETLPARVPKLLDPDTVAPSWYVELYLKESVEEEDQVF